MNCYFFGTFNPVHLGHIEISRRIKELFDFERVIFVPCYMPPHKHDNLISYKYRLEMTRLAVGIDNVSDVEFHLKIPSYTYRTLEYLYKENNNSKINFIIGYDQFFQLENWREPSILKELTTFIVIPRKFQNGQLVNDKVFEYFENKGYDFKIADIGFLDVSSSQIRESVKNNLDITGLTTLEVKNYIEEHRLYKNMAQEKPVR